MRSPTATSHPRPPRARSELNLNLTSMIDVVFLLLVYFVLTASFAPHEGVLLSELPGVEADTEEQPPPPPLTLRVELRPAGVAGCRIHLAHSGTTLSDFAELRHRLNQMRYDKRSGGGLFNAETSPVEIRVHPEVRWQHAVNAFNAAVSARYQRVNLVPAG